MRRRHRRNELLVKLGLAAVAAQATLAAGCAPGLTEVIVLVDSDLTMPAEADRITVEVAQPSGFVEERVWQSADGGSLPLSMQIEGGDEDADEVTVTATAWRGNQLVVAQTQRFALVDGESRRIDLTLCSSCRLVAPCAAGETCSDGACVAVTAATDEWNGDPDAARQCSALTHCPPGMALREDGRCQPAGIPPDACAEGFVADGTGACAAVLPATACADGTLAVPGETECHELAPCAAGTWGDIPIAADTVHVDASYTGAQEDGSAERPYRSIQAAVDAAPAGATVAVAAGQYDEAVRITSKGVVLWGVCPALVEIAASGFAVDAIVVEDAPGTVLRSFSVSAGPARAVGIASPETVIDRVRVHDVGWYGIHVEATGDAIVSDSLIERASASGVFCSGTVAIVRSTIRDTRVATNSDGGQDASGVATFPSGTVQLSRSTIERSGRFGAVSAGGDLAIEGSVVRDTDAGPGKPTWGYGIYMFGDPTDPSDRGSLTVRGSTIDNNAGAGIRVEVSDGTVETTVVRDTRAAADPDAPSGFGIVLRGSDVDVNDAARLTLEWSVVERSASNDLQMNGSDATLVASVLRDVSAVAGAISGFGAEATRNKLTKAPSTLSVQGSVVEHVHNVGLRMVDSDLTLQRSVVRDVVSGGESGDCIAVMSDVGTSVANVEGSHLAACERVGLFNAGSQVTISQNRFRCSPLHIDGEPFVGRDPVFVDLGGNSCGCDGETAACVVQQAGLPVPFLVDESDGP